jgi:hypothetical protein
VASRALGAFIKVFLRVAPVVLAIAHLGAASAASGQETPAQGFPAQPPPALPPPPPPTTVVLVPAPTPAVVLASPPARAANDEGSPVRLMTLRLMREKGIITQAEYESALRDVVDTSGV